MIAKLRPAPVSAARTIDERRTMLLTGATSGLGLALARQLLANAGETRERVLLVGRRPVETLELPHFDTADYCRVDLRLPNAAMQVARFLEDRSVHRLDWLVHNAAVGWYGPLTEQPQASVREILDVNLWAPLALTHRLLPLVVRVAGKIVIVSSVAAALPAPEYAVYTASKAALEGWARNLRVELFGKAQVQVIRPGPTRTGLHEKLGVPKDKAPTERFAAVEVVAEKLIRAVRGRRAAVILGTANACAHLAGRHFPRMLDGMLRRQRYNSAPAVGNAGPSQQMRRADGAAGGCSAAGPHCVITGSAAGIGKALADRWLSTGAAVTGIDRDPCPAIGKTIGTITTYQTDLATPAGIAYAAEALLAGPAIDVLIHNAGVSHLAAFGKSDLAEQRTVVDVNLRAPLLLTATLLREHKLASGATIVFIASLSHFTGYPGASVYAATKDGLVSYARSLSLALAPHRMGVLTVFPGPTRTEHARRYSPDNRNERRRMAPERLAALVYGAVRRRRTRLVPGLSNRLFAFAGHCLPALTEGILCRSILRRLK